MKISYKLDGADISFEEFPVLHALEHDIGRVDDTFAYQIVEDEDWDDPEIGALYSPAAGDCPHRVIYVKASLFARAERGGRAALVRRLPLRNPRSRFHYGRDGAAVNVMDLGTLFITADASAESENASDITVAGFSAGFTPSALTNSTLKTLSVSKVTVADNTPRIEQLFDTYDDEEHDDFTAGARVRMTGAHLKLGGETSGLFLCPTDGEGSASGDEGPWTKIADNLLKVNLVGRIEFIIPRGQETGNYRVLLRTSYAGGGRSLKAVREAWSEVIRVGTA